MKKNRKSKQTRKAVQKCTISEREVKWREFLNNLPTLNDIESQENLINSNNIPIQQLPEYKQSREYAFNMLFRLPLTVEEEFENALKSIPKHDAVHLACLEAGYNHEGWTTKYKELKEPYMLISGTIHNYAMQKLEHDEEELLKWWRLVD